MRAFLLAILCVTTSACGTDWYLDRGQDAVETMDLVRAERSFRSALTREPDNPEALYGLGWTYHLAGHRAEARETFERCVSVAPENALGFKGLGSVALAEGNLDVATQRFEQALERAPGDPAIRNSLALLHIRAERPEDALELYQSLLSERPDDPSLMLGQAEALVRTGQGEGAREVVDAALQLDSLGPREEALLLLLRARILHDATTGRLDDQRCAETAPPLLVWLDEADASLDRAEAVGLEIENLHGVRREVHRRRRLVLGRCPDLGGTQGSD